MKKCLLLLLVSVCIIFIKSFSQETFSKKVKINGSPFEGKTIKAVNEDLLVPLNTDSGAYIVRVSKTGTVRWEKLYGSKASYNIDICATKDNGFAFYSDLFNASINAYELSLIKCDSSGNIQWSRSIQPDYKSSYIYPDQLITNSQEDYIITYDAKYKTSPYPARLQLLKFDKYGNLIFQTGFTNLFDRNYQSLGLNSVIESFNGGYLIGFSYFEAESGVEKGYFLLTNKSGDLISYKQFGPPHINFYDADHPVSVFKSNDRYYVLGYYFYYDYPYEKEYYYITSFKSNTTTTTGKFVPYNAFALQRFAEENNITNKQLDKYFIDESSLSYIDFIKIKNNSTVTFSFNKYDSAGRVCPDYTLPFYRYDTSSKNISFGNEIQGANKIIDSITITNDRVTEKNVHAIQNICSGKTPFITKTNTSQKVIVTSTTSTLFPNPAHNTITISIPSIKNQQLQLYNAEGKLLQSMQVNDHQITLNISRYKNGFYVIKIVGSDQTQILKFIKQ